MRDISTESLGSLPNMKQRTISAWNKLFFKASKIGKRFIFSLIADTNYMDDKNATSYF